MSKYRYFFVVYYKNIMPNFFLIKKVVYLFLAYCAVKYVKLARIVLT